MSRHPLLRPFGPRRVTADIPSRTRALMLGALLLAGPAARAAALPLGDGYISSHPRRGYVMSCLRHWRPGRQHGGPWIRGDVWYPSRKPHVAGDVRWQGHRFRIRHVGRWLRITGNDIPAHGTGIFPISPSDPVFRYDTNPNAIRPQSIRLALPYAPRLARRATCVPMGKIGIALDGTLIFDALDNGGLDAAAHEVQDRCNGHPDRRGTYHYHGPSPCVPHEHGSGLIGYALDGFGIYGRRDLSSGRVLTNSDLGPCHGIVSRVRWHGRVVRMFHYVLTDAYPYTVGCLRGRVPRRNLAPPQRHQMRRFNQPYDVGQPWHQRPRPGRPGW